jgi:malate dehydrogenase (oxaloacetate-decarboxylating)
MDYAKESLKKHYEWRGKLDITAKAPIGNKEELSLAYTPGVAAPCLEIQKDVTKSYELTGRWNTVAVVTDGTAVLGLGDIGPEAAMPVMEGKCVIFKQFGGVNGVPICLRTKDTDKIVETVALLAGSFGGINLEDISAPRCFEIERRLKEICDIPVFHDDQHGTAVVTLAAIINALKLTGGKLADQRVVVSGAGAAGSAVTRLLLAVGLRDVVVCDRAGAIYAGRENMDPAKASLAAVTNPDKRKGLLADVIKGANIFIGVSSPGIVNSAMVASMAKNPVIFALSNPVPEIMPEEAFAGGAAVVGTGRSDMPNQINNSLAFPGIFRGAFDVRAKDINDDMKIAAANAIASLVSDKELSPGFIIPDPFNPRIREKVASAVGEAARKSGVARI